MKYVNVLSCVEPLSNLPKLFQYILLIAFRQLNDMTNNFINCMIVKHFFDRFIIYNRCKK